jgi:RNA polymerase sporulation-specific sigma factor
MNETALLRKYDHILRGAVRNWYFPGSDKQDVYQEAAIGMLRAARTWNGEGDLASWLGFCVRRHMIVCVKAALREKHRPLTESVRVGEDADGELVNVVDYLPDPIPLEREVIARAQLYEIRERMGKLTETERAGIATVVNGHHYRGNKTVDNALQRARKKLAPALA